MREILLLNKIIVGGNKMALTEKGLNALGHVKTYFPI
jgi:hypothetical protein